MLKESGYIFMKESGYMFMETGPPKYPKTALYALEPVPYFSISSPPQGGR